MNFASACPMGKRRANRGAPRKQSLKMDARFDCPVCNHESVVQCKVVRKMQRGVALCNACDAHYGCDVSPLDGPVDVYHSWIDSLDGSG